MVLAVRFSIVSKWLVTSAASSMLGVVLVALTGDVREKYALEVAGSLVFQPTLTVEVLTTATTLLMTGGVVSAAGGGGARVVNENVSESALLPEASTERTIAK